MEVSLIVTEGHHDIDLIDTFMHNFIDKIVSSLKDDFRVKQTESPYSQIFNELLCNTCFLSA